MTRGIQLFYKGSLFRRFITFQLQNSYIIHVIWAGALNSSTQASKR